MKYPTNTLRIQEIGITGGEEDGVNNEDVDNNSLYTQPEVILAIYKALVQISPYFSIAAGRYNKISKGMRADH